MQEELVADARDFDRILEGHKDAFTGAIFRGEFQQIFALKLDGPADHFIIFTPGQRRGERTFPGAVWPHNGVHFTRTDVNIQPTQDRFIFHTDL
ncbi:hypothetical protein D3C72_2148080 [compost metagenome]